MNRKKLILGNIPEDYSSEKYDVIAPWCFLCNKEYLKLDNLPVEPDPFNNHNEIKIIGDKANRIVDSKMPFLVEFLNRRNNTEYSQKFWEILLLPWLTTLTQVVLERERRIIKYCANLHEPVEVELLELHDECWNFDDTIDFINNGVMDIDFNHWIFSKIISSIENKNLIKTIKKITPGKHQTIKKKLRSRINDWLIKNFFFTSVYGVNKFEGIIWDILIRKFTINDKQKSNDSKSLLKKNENITEIILKTIPNYFLNIPKKKFKKNVLKRKIICGPILYYNEDIKLTLAEHSEKGSEIIPVQHGGRYGTLNSIPFISKVEFEKDKFITWGWDKQSNYKGNFVPLPNPYLKVKKRRTNNKIILVGQYSSLFSYRLDSSPQPLDYLKIKNQIKIFLKTLNPDLMNNLVYRPYPRDEKSLDMTDFMLEYKNLYVLNGKLNEKILFGAKLIIMDNPGTIMHRVLAANIPFIGFWDRDIWGISEEAQPFFDNLRSVGILFEDGKTAANKVNEIWDNVDNWWQKANVQIARKEWFMNYAKPNVNWRWAWLKAVRNLSKNY